MAQRVPVLLEFGRRVRCKREAAGISQESFAAMVGVHRTYIGAVERGERNLSLRNIVRIAAALNCDSSELLLKLSEGGSE